MTESLPDGLPAKRGVLSLRCESGMGTIGLSVWNHPQRFAIVCNLIYLRARVCKARLNGQYRKGYEIATESKSGAN